ncbi:MAG: putative zinc-binding protein [Syntrophaceae bacterium]|nr:putative zinc-binding protein [Syntrophaceae bacterium]
MDIKVLKVGIVSCSGEALPEGTVSRVASRKVLDELRPGQTVTICLPLFIAGGKEEREFASKFPTVTVDGCEKMCAAKSTEKLSGKPAKSLMIKEILKKQGISGLKQCRGLGPAEKVASDVVADEIAKAVDEALE